MLLIGNINMMLHDFNSYSKLETRLRLYRSPDFPFPFVFNEVPLVEQELLTLPEHLSPPTVFSFGHCVVCPFVLFLLAIVLSVLLRFSDSDYPFGIFKLFLL